MNLKRAVQLVSICLLVLAGTNAGAFAQKNQGSIPDSSKSARNAKSAAAKTYTSKSFESKRQADFSGMRFSRNYASDSFCVYETKKGLRCKRKAQMYSRYCRQHDPQYTTNDGTEKQKQLP
jgi:hypothetical protein